MSNSIEKTIKYLSTKYKIPPLDSDDIAQELRLHLLTKDKEGIEDYNQWAFIVCKRKILDLARKYKNHTISIENIEIEDPNNMQKQYEASTFLIDIIKSLPRQQKRVASLRVYDDLTLKEIAKKMNISEKTVNEHWKRAKVAIEREIL